jgi:MFS superfamily sulfate permease-like transporter
MSAATRPLVSDASASVVVFLVALPLCLGIAHGSNAPLMSGIVAGIVGGVVIGLLSKSTLSVSGPAAGLIAIVAGAIARLDSWDAFALTVVLAGVFQVAFGVFKLGSLGDLIPNSVVRGMLAAIGILLILKQMPHLIGYDADFEGDEGFQQNDEHNTFSALLVAVRALSPTALGVGASALGIMILWEAPFFSGVRRVTRIPSALAAVALGVTVHTVIAKFRPELALGSEHMVNIPAVSVASLGVGFPDFGALGNPLVWRYALTLAVVASLETLLGVAAVDKLDPLRRVTPPNRELVAQGIGNTVSGFLGGLPLTSVIVRSAANVGAGAVSRWSTVMHGFWLLLATLFAAPLMNQIPLAALAAVLVLTGFKLAKPSLFREMYLRGPNQIIPFVITILGVVFTDLLIGIVIGLSAGLLFVVRTNFRSTSMLVRDGDRALLRLRKDVTFLNKGGLRDSLEAIGDGTKLVVDFSQADFVDQDVRDVLSEFVERAHTRNISVEVRERGQPVTSGTPLNADRLQAAQTSAERLSA